MSRRSSAPSPRCMRELPPDTEAGWLDAEGDLRLAPDIATQAAHRARVAVRGVRQEMRKAERVSGIRPGDPRFVKPPISGGGKPEHLGQHRIGVLAEPGRRARSARAASAAKSSGRPGIRYGRCPAARPARTTGSPGAARVGGDQLSQSPGTAPTARRCRRRRPDLRRVWPRTNGRKRGDRVARLVAPGLGVGIGIDLGAGIAKASARPVAPPIPRHWRGVSAMIMTRRPSLVAKSRPKLP